MASTNLRDLLIPGKPILVTARSANGAEMICKECVWNLGKEPRILDIEFLDSAGIKSSWQSFNEGDHVIVTGASRADELAQKELAAIMNDQDRIVSVADSEVPQYLQPESFAHWGKF